MGEHKPAQKGKLKFKRCNACNNCKIIGFDFVKGFVCSLCTTSSIIADITEHHHNVHPGQPLSAKKMWGCMKDCNRLFSRKANLKRHYQQFIKTNCCPPKPNGK